MNARVLFLIVGLLSPVVLWAQGFAGLGSDADGFSVPAPNPAFEFPADHGAHPDYRIEWWYLTANLTGEDGRDYGVQWTLFRSALAPRQEETWASPQIWFAHAAVTTPDAHFATERFSRDGIGQAGVQADPFRAWIDDWELAGPRFDTATLRASGPSFRYEMSLQAQGPLVFHGDAGYSVKSAEGQASYYYSQPFYAISGTLHLPTGPVRVHGQAWLDREWSSQPLSERQSGWDWFALSFESGDKLMGFQLRQEDGQPFTAATWIYPTGETQSYPSGDFDAEPLAQSRVAGRDVPTRWRVTLPDRGLDVEVSALNPQSWMDLTIPYWEGPVRVRGTHAGRGYLEMTGYE